MPVVQHLMDALVARYGAEKAKTIYYAMEASGRGPFAKGAKYEGLHVAFARKDHLAPILKKPAKKRPRGRR